MTKSKNWIQLLVGGAIGLFLTYTDFTPGTKTAVIVGIFLYMLISEQNKRFKKVEESIGLPQESDVQEENIKTPSYKLDIHIEPSWFSVYKNVSGEKSEKKLEKELKAKVKKTEDKDANLWGRRYYFTEFYDSSTGLTSRFQRVIFPSGKQLTYPVDEFGDSGYFFESDGDIGLVFKENEKQREYRKKLSIEIGENYIRNDIFDKHIGGPKSDFDYKDENYLFRFPLHDIFNFLLALGQRFHDTERNTIIKWPDSINKKFKEQGIKYETHFDGEPTPFDIKKEDKEFFEKWGKPEVSLYTPSRFGWSSLESKNGTNFSVVLKIFRPGENDRISARN